MPAEHLVLTDPDSRDEARELAEQLHHNGRHLAVVPDLASPHAVVDAKLTGDVPTAAVPQALVELVTTVLETVARGGTLRITTLPKELSTTVAAAELGISRPTLMKMIKRGEIDAHKVGSHTRLDAADVVRFKENRAARQREATSALRDMDIDL
jgi:excisionase family DNA binding protein